MTETSPPNGSTGCRKGCLVGALVCIAGAVLLIGGLLLFVRRNAPEPLPTDAELIANFQKNRADFDRVRKLVEERGTQLRLDPEKPKPQPANATEAELLALLDRLGIRHGVHMYAEPVLVAGSEGDHLSAFQKGYTFRAEPPVSDEVRRIRVANSLDEQTDPTTQWTSYRPIGDGWYLYMIGGD